MYECYEEKLNLKQVRSIGNTGRGAGWGGETRCHYIQAGQGRPSLWEGERVNQADTCRDSIPDKGSSFSASFKIMTFLNTFNKQYRRKNPIVRNVIFYLDEGKKPNYSEISYYYCNLDKNKVVWSQFDKVYTKDINDSKKHDKKVQSIPILMKIFPLQKYYLLENK